MTTHLHYETYGHGPQTLILLHGFGQTNQAFVPLIPYLENHFRVISIDLFYHGHSRHENRPLSKNEWLAHFKNLMKKENFESFSLMAFSLGGRFAIATALGFPLQTKDLYLIAPDGIHANIWYRFATSPLGNPIFKRLMLKPQLFEKWIYYFEKYGLTSPSMIRFAKKELQDRQNCLRVYQSWTYFRPLQHTIREVTTSLNKYSIKTSLVLGAKDNIISQKHICPKMKGVKQLKTHILPYKHHQLIDGLKEYVPQIFSDH